MWRWRRVATADQIGGKRESEVKVTSGYRSILERSLREACTTPWYICQPAVRRSVGILTFSPSMKNHSAYNIQIYMSVK